MRGLNLFLLAFPLELAAMALGYTSLALIANALAFRILWPYFVLMAFTLRREQLPSRRALQFFFASITLLLNLFWMFSSGQAGVTSTIGRQLLIARADHRRFFCPDPERPFPAADPGGAAVRHGLAGQVRISRPGQP
jgi:hypothetical protein